MPTRFKAKEGEQVMYQDQVARVLKVNARQVEIRDVYGYVRSVKKSELSPYNK